MNKHRLLALPLAAAALLAAALLAPRTDASASAALPSQWNLSHTCTFCHDPHGGPNPANLRNADVEVLCLSCHGPGGTASTRAVSHRDFTCLDCHDKHRHVTNRTGGENIKAVGARDPVTGLATIQGPHGPRQVTFESRGLQAGQPTLHSFADDDQDNDGVFDGVCEVCHLTPGGSWEPDNHNFGQTCTVCHSHGDGFDPP